jgi:hypothetical protein
MAPPFTRLREVGLKGAYVFFVVTGPNSPTLSGSWAYSRHFVVEGDRGYDM